MKSVYAGVSKPGYRERGWVAQNKKAGLWKGGFDSEEEAASWLARALGLSRRSLLRSDEGPAARQRFVVSRFRGVVRRSRPQGDLWEARGAHGKYVGTYTSERAAAKAVARVLGVPVSKLQRKEPFTRRAACAVFRASYKTFRRYMPGDLQHLYQQESKCQAVFQKETCSE